MKISVIIPIFNVEKYLQKCVDSVLCQTYKNLEIILVDDGSPDKCPTICDNYVKIDNRIKVIHKQNGGLSDARNLGIEVATGEYIICLDSDDWWIGDNAIEDAVALLSQNPDILFFERITFCNNGVVIYPKEMGMSIINEMLFDDALKVLMKSGKFIPSACNKFVKRDILVKGNITFKKGIVCEDIDWTFKLMPFVKKMMWYNNPFYGYRKRVGSITTNIGKRNVNDLLSIIEYWSTEIERFNYNNIVKYQLLGYLNYQRFIVMGLLLNLSKYERKEFYSRIDALVWLSKYDINKKTHFARIVQILFNDKLTRYILSFYIKIKNKGLKIQ